MERSLLQAEKLAASGRMAATIAHEINNPLEAVLNLIYLARANRFAPDQVDSFLGSAESELIRLSHIAKQTLGFYRENTSPICVPLSEVVSDALKIYCPKLRSSRVTVETQLLSTRSLVIKKGEIMQVISNLIANAGYAMPEGGTLSVCVQDATNHGKDGVELTIRDTGCGIPQENMAKLFEPFYTTRSAIGTGIGLWVARQFIEGHGGSISLESTTDPAAHGTTVSIFLPLQTAVLEP